MFTFNGITHILIVFSTQIMQLESLVNKFLHQLYLLNSPKRFDKFTMVNADTTKYSSIKLDYLFWILGISIISNAHQLFWIESLASYFEIQNR